MWTQFWDMCSGGGKKEKWEQIYIESASEQEAMVIFWWRFGHNPERVSCTCCGEDYSISSHESLSVLTGYHRGCDWDKASGNYAERPDPGRNKYIPLDEYMKLPECLFIAASEVKPEKKVGELPRQGYVWQD
jgi:hypothetical protein